MLKKMGQLVHQSYFVVGLCAGIVAGTVLALLFRVNYFASPIWIVVTTMLLIFAFIRPRFAFVIIAVVAGMILAFFRASTELIGEDYIDGLRDQTVMVTATVDGDPNSDEKGTKIKLKNLQFGEERVRVQGSLFITVKQTGEIKRADEIVVKGKMLDGFGTYAGYMYKPSIESVKRPEPGDLVLMIRNWFAERVEKLIPEPEVKLGLSYLLGMKSDLPEEMNENLRAVGLTHIVVASGAHLSILVEIARRVFGRISRFAGLLFSVLFIVFFMAVVGFTPSIMRAGVMAILVLMVWYTGRKFAPWRIILITAALTLIVNPMYVINLGWLLSFASFGGIMILGPELARFFYGSKKPGFIASVILTTIAATLMTLPITLYFFGAVSLISLVANLLILPTLPVAMGLVFLTGVVSGVPFVETCVAFLATKLLDFHIAVVEFFGGMRQFMVEIPPYQAWTFVLYIIIVMPFIMKWVWVKYIKRKKKIVL